VRIRVLSRALTLGAVGDDDRAAVGPCLARRTIVVVVVEATTHACVLVTGEPRWAPAAGVTAPEAVDAAALGLVLRQTLAQRTCQRKTRGVRIGEGARVVDVGVTTADAPPSVRRVVRLAAACEQEEAKQEKPTHQGPSVGMGTVVPPRLPVVDEIGKENDIA